MKKVNKIKMGRSDKIYYTIVTLLLGTFLLMVLYPVLFVLASSFSSANAITAGRVYFWPVEFSLSGYSAVFNNKNVFVGFGNSFFYAIFDTLVTLALTMTAAYGLAKKDVPGSKYIMYLLTFTMFFGGGMIPTYLLMKNLHLINTRLVLILPGAVGAYNVIVCRTFIRNSIPEELYQAASIDGCDDIRYYFKIVLPLSKAIMAVQALFAFVGSWNNYFGPMLYLNDNKLYPLPIFLKEILLASSIDPSVIDDPELLLMMAQVAEGIKYSLIVVTLIPVFLIYPFVQKYFVKGVMVGSIKG